MRTILFCVIALAVLWLLALYGGMPANWKQSLSEGIDKVEYHQGVEK